MKNADIQSNIAQYKEIWKLEVLQLAAFRPSILSQQQMAKITGKSLRTIQRFEKGKTFDPVLKYTYELLIKPR